MPTSTVTDEYRCTAAELPWERQRLKVPREDRTLFARPALHEAVRAGVNNPLNGAGMLLLGTPLSELREQTRREMLALAKAYTEQLLKEELPEPGEGPLFVTGHQPALVHPGVWVKNFALHSMARETGGVGLNLIVDNDTVSNRQIRVPVGSRENPQAELVAFDDPAPRQPWEEARVQNPERFRQFAGLIEERMGRWGVVPMLRCIWPLAVRKLEETDRLSELLTAARVEQEHAWRRGNLELPLSRLPQVSTFRHFVLHLLSRLDCFHTIHNEVLAKYRQVNRVRSRTHPVPELHEIDGWKEAPFWVWRADSPRRGRLYVRRTDTELLLSDDSRADILARLPLPLETHLAAASEQLAGLAEQGIRLRTRALTTTLFSRVYLADLFVHGIGGAKYDEMTDRIICRFYQIKPPAFLTLSATLHLPLGEPFNVTSDDERRLQQQLRDLEQNPQRHLTPHNSETQALLDRRRELVASQQAWNAPQNRPSSERRPHRRENYDRFRELKQLTGQLVPHTARLRELLQRELATVQEQLAANRLLQDREFAWCLYPADKLKSLLWNLPAGGK